MPSRVVSNEFETNIFDWTKDIDTCVKVLKCYQTRIETFKSQKVNKNAV